MKPRLMHRDRDFNLRRQWPPNHAVLMQDLELDTLLRAMAAGDRFLYDVAQAALLTGTEDSIDTVIYRQEILRDCLQHRAVIRQLYYDVVVQTIENRRKSRLGIYGRFPGSILYEAIKLLEMLVGVLKKLRCVAAAHARDFESEGFTTFFAMIERELSDEYLARIESHLADLKFRRGVLLSAGLGPGNEGVNYTLRQAPGKGPGWLKRLLGQGPPAYTFRLADRDEAGARILSHMRDCGISRVANALGQSADHVLSFFEALRLELGFYVACLNLYERLLAKGEPVCFPRPAPAGQRRHRFSGLYDPCLSLLMDERVVGNTADADGKRLIVITGANQGGKSIFLRSIGLAQLMMQAGMIVAAEAFEAESCPSLFTHYKREEDATMRYGKLDEELARMSEIADHIGPNSLLLCNESFAATNQREGSEIARQIVGTMLEKRIKVLFVTHLYDFARGLYDARSADALFLRAERQPDGTRTFRLVEGEPLETSYGEDVYQEVFPQEAESQADAESLARRTQG